MHTIKWGIIAPGSIAQKFAQALQQMDSGVLHSVASRNPERAQQFAKTFGATKTAADYQSLIADPDIDAIYIASPHRFHAEQSIACLNAGKAVLCEKPMTVNRHEAQRVLQAAKDNNAFYMEAVWSRFLPTFKQLKCWLDAGEIGTVSTVTANFGISRLADPSHRLFNQSIAGGALLDVGIYPITLAQCVFNRPPSLIKAIGRIGETQVDEQTSLLLQYSEQHNASLNCAITNEMQNDGWVYGSQGKIHLPDFWKSDRLTLINQQGEHTLDLPHQINGFEGQIEETHRCLQQGLIESPNFTWEQSLNVMAIMDEVREQIGLRYAFEDD